MRWSELVLLFVILFVILFLVLLLFFDPEATNTSPRTTASLINMTTIHHNELVNSLSNLFGSSKYSDLTIRCGSDLYKVHRAVICQRSDFFAVACDSGFKVHDGQSMSQRSC